MQFLTDYQDAALAQRYQALVQAVQQREVALGRQPTRGARR
ncbi:MAG: DUF6537 domain-containing protein [Burkholderiaceae bacterium]